MKRKLHTHYIFTKSREKGKRRKHLVNQKHRNKDTLIRHQREIKFYNAFGEHTYNF